MSLEQIREALGWCVVIDIGLLLWWWAFISLAHDFVYRMHTRWFRMTVEQFDAIHYAGIALLKLMAFVLHVVPWLALVIVG